MPPICTENLAGGRPVQTDDGHLRPLTARVFERGSMGQSSREAVLPTSCQGPLRGHPGKAPRQLSSARPRSVITQHRSGQAGQGRLHAPMGLVTDQGKLSHRACSLGEVIPEPSDRYSETLEGMKAVEAPMGVGLWHREHLKSEAPRPLSPRTP